MELHDPLVIATQEMAFQLSLIANALQRLAPASTTNLGFRSNDFAIPIKIGRKEKAQAPWSTYDHTTKKRVDITDHILEGYLKSVSVRTEQTTEGPRDRLALLIQADQLYRVSAGIDLDNPRDTTVAAKGMLLDLAHLRPEQIRSSPILIQVNGSDQKPTVIFVSITIPGVRSPRHEISKEQRKAFKMQPELLAKAIQLTEMAWGAVDEDDADDDEAPPPPRVAPPARPSPAQTAQMTQKQLVLHVAGEQLIAQSLLVKLVKDSLKEASLDPEATLDNLTPVDYASFFDRFLCNWALTIKVKGAEPDIEEPLFLTEEELNQAYSSVSAMYQNPTPYQLYTGWSTTISQMLEPAP